MTKPGIIKICIPGGNLKSNKKWKRIKEYKEKKSSKLRNKNFGHLRNESSLCKESRFKPFCGWDVVNRSNEYVGVTFSWKTPTPIHKY